MDTATPTRRLRPVGSALAALSLVAACASAGSATGGPAHPQGTAGPIASMIAASLGPVSMEPLEADRTLPSSPGTPAPLAAPGEGTASPGTGVPTAALAPQPVPANLVPSLSKARKDLPAIYSNGCHLSQAATTPRTCAFGDTSSRTRVILVGDSNAAEWFPALRPLAWANHWRLESLTKSACTMADIAVWNTNFRRVYSECATWRSLVLRRIKAERPALVIVAVARGSRIMVGGHAVPIAGHEATFKAALTRTLRTLKATSRGVVLLGTTPVSRVDPPVCLAAHRSDAGACATPLAQAVSSSFRSLEIAAAKAAGARWVDPTAWVCRADPCPAIVGRILVYRDAGHMTATFSAALRSRLGAALPAVR